MKKVALAVLVLGLAAGIGTGQAFAQDKKVEFSLNLSVLSSFSGEYGFENIGLGLIPQLDIRLAKRFMISPEIMIFTDFEFGGVYVFPGLLLNYAGKGVFAGAGITLPMAINLGWWGAEVDPPGLKVNIGYRGKHINLTAYLITTFQDMFADNLIGAGIGYRF